MCGILGIVTSEESQIDASITRKILENLLVVSMKRGLESTGLVVKSPQSGEISILRKTVNASKFVKTREFKNLMNECEQTGFRDLEILGHARIATNGALGADNQPIVKNGAVGIHNGIICNIEDLWESDNHLARQQLIDTEWLFGALKEKIDKGESLNQSLHHVFSKLEGTASFGVVLNNKDGVILGTNCGSLYFYEGEGIFIFASESLILKEVLEESSVQFSASQIVQVKPLDYGYVDKKSLAYKSVFDSEEVHLKGGDEYKVVDKSNDKYDPPYINNYSFSELEKMLEYPKSEIDNIKRCTKCILPETHPFISFDEQGICNYCRDYEKRPVAEKGGMAEFEEKLSAMRAQKGQNCIILVSGGRDSCYALHLVKKELGLNPYAYSYDWGMLTDLGRRNQARLCGKLGVEHLVVSADIKKKRRYIRKNVEAWLHKPHLGTIGLFMAGDKAYHYYAMELYRSLNLPLINGGNPLEYTYFKHGFSGVKPSFEKKTPWDKFNIVKFFALQALSNPKYLNESVMDNLNAFRHYFMQKMEWVFLFKYLDWNEDKLNQVLFDEYNWELAPDTPTSWRIGDGTAAFYNYIYNTVAGFTENDCFRSNQILHGIITRDEALERAERENQPRFESMKWYFDTIGVDMKYALERVNSIPKLYRN